MSVTTVTFAMRAAVTGELRRAFFLQSCIEHGSHRTFARSFPRGHGFFLLRLHGFVESVHVERVTGVLRGFFHQVNGKAERVVQFENLFAGNGGRLVLLHLVENFVQTLGADGECRVEIFFLVGDDFLDKIVVHRQVGIHLLELGDHVLGDVMKKRVFLFEQFAVTQRPAHDSPQHITASLVGRQYAVVDQERARTRMIRNHPQRNITLVTFTVFSAGDLTDVLDQPHHNVGVIIARLALHYRGEAFESHAGVDARAGQGSHLARLVAFELHEHQVPHFQITVAVAPDRTGRLAATQRFPLVDEDFRTGTAWTGRAHGPEIVLVAEPENPVVGQFDFLLPQLGGLVVVLVDGGIQLVDRQFHLLRQEIPGEDDGVLLEVVAEGKVAQHLEEGMMPRGAPDLFEVVVLAAGTHAFLGGRRAGVAAFLLPEEHVLERHHPGVGEQQGGVVLWHQRIARHHGVAAFREKVKKSFAYFVTGHKRSIIYQSFANRMRDLH